MVKKRKKNKPKEENRDPEVEPEVVEEAEEKAEAIEAREAAAKEKQEAEEARAQAKQEKAEAIEARAAARKELQLAEAAQLDAIREKAEAVTARADATREKQEAIEARKAAALLKRRSIKKLREVRQQEVRIATNAWTETRVLDKEPLRDDDDIYRLILAPAKRMLKSEKKAVRTKTQKRMIQNMINATERQCEYMQEDRDFLSNCFKLVRPAHSSQSMPLADC